MIDVIPLQLEYTAHASVEPVEWDANNCPRSLRFNDIYRSRSGGLQQARTVFLGGCQLPHAWRQQPQFTILETGFGLGLNFLATWAAWEADPDRCAQLHYVAIEAYPVAAADITRSVAALDSPQLHTQAQALADAWYTLNTGITGTHRLRIARQDITLTLAIGDVQQMLPLLQLRQLHADTVYLDGFSPALNPEMWSQPTLNAIARLCHPGTTLATYSTAPGVRQGLANAGFVVHRRPGLPPKRHRLEARFDPDHLS